jgi:glycosyltransferase involved in cell wall biosynthesis
VKLAFCAYGVPADAFVRVEFYRQDIEILRSLGHTVSVISSPLELQGKYDAAFVWWWNYLFLWGPIFSLTRTPVLVTGVFDLEATARWHWLKRRVKLLSAQFADHHIFVSRAELDAVPPAVGIERGRTSFCPLSVDTNVYRVTARRTADDYKILNVSWHRESNMQRKMIPELVQAFALFVREVPNARLCLAGKLENGTPVLRRLAAELGVSNLIEFPGELSLEQKIEAMQQCSLYVQVSHFEGFGLAIAEAMACGAPVLVSNRGAVPEVVGHHAVPVMVLTVEGILNGLREAHQRSDSVALRDQRSNYIRENFSSDRRRKDLDRVISSVLSSRIQADGLITRT